MENRLIGRWGERVAAEELQRRGFQILCAGFRTRFGEIDLIAQNGQFLTFVEVKVRKNAAYGTAAEAVNVRKQERLRATAEIFLARHPTALQPRFDVAEIYAEQGYATKEPQVNLIENAF